jgi:hypothetical protein
VRGLDLEEVALVDHLPDQLVHVVGLVGDAGISVSRLGSARVVRIGGRPRGHLLAVSTAAR